eukprot:1148516-Pelagomonas_calceolata.AAC.2
MQQENVVFNVILMISCHACKGFLEKCKQQQALEQNAGLGVLEALCFVPHMCPFAKAYVLR